MCARTHPPLASPGQCNTLLPRRGPRRRRVQKERDAPMRAYELMVIFDSSLDDLVVDEQVKSVAAQIATRGASVASTDRWGRRRFAYQNDHKTDGGYVVWEVTPERADLEGLERSPRLAGGQYG